VPFAASPLPGRSHLRTARPRRADGVSQSPDPPGVCFGPGSGHSGRFFHLSSCLNNREDPLVERVAENQGRSASPVLRVFPPLPFSCHTMMAYCCKAKGESANGFHAERSGS
jgi:hypothetical protein